MSKVSKGKIIRIVIACVAVLALLAGGLFVLRYAKQRIKQMYFELSSRIDAVGQIAAVQPPEQHTPYTFDYSWIEDTDGYVAHAFGEVDGYTYTNSMEAFEANYARGHRVFEVDLDYTLDDYSVVLTHDEESWRAERADVADDFPFTHDNFMNTPTNGLFTPVDLEGLIQIMDEHPDIYIVLDTHHFDRQSVIIMFSQIVSEAQRVDPRILNRIVPQVYNEDMFWTVMQVYEFKSIIFTLYATEWTPESVYDFCFRSGCRYVTLWDYLLTPEMLALWDTQGINVAVHTVNDQEAADAFFDMGVDMIYTDSLPA